MKGFKKIITLSFIGISMGTLAACGKSSSSITLPEIKIEPEDRIDWNSEVLGESMVDPIDDNYRVFYQIFPISYSDSNKDGKGDLKGIINRLDYLNDGDVNSGKSLGIQGIWLNPIFSSPSYHKYDVTDYYKIDKTFGSMKDLQKLIEECHNRNIILILDLVINHTSSQNTWFKEFCKAHINKKTNSKYYNYYEWTTTPQSGHQYELVPNTKDCYYEANFSPSMPELNFDNEDVYNEMVNVAKYYIDLGIDGFRFDAAKYIYFNNHTKSIAFWKRYIKEIEDYTKATKNKKLYTVAEVYDTDTVSIPYNEALNTFDFGVADLSGKISSAAKGGNASTFTEYVTSYVSSIKAKNSNAMMIPFITNHDMNRSAGFLDVSTGEAFVAANLNLLCPGSPYIYYGEEIGMKGARANNTDQNRRLAMLWGDLDTIKDPKGSTYDAKYQINGTVREQIDRKSSLLTHYRHLIQLRNKYKGIGRGTYTSLSISNKLGGFKVEYNQETIAIIHNTTTDKLSVDISTLGYSYTELKEIIGLGNATLNGTTLTIDGQTSIILK